jgi:hypothetical protein
MKQAAVSSVPFKRTRETLSFMSRASSKPGRKHAVPRSVFFRTANIRNGSSEKLKITTVRSNLGNWHTHHVNGLQHLSGGDIETYYRNVNHRNHNTPFFYALLVTAKHRSKDPLGRYTVKHYVFRRGDERIYELHRGQVQIIQRPLVWPQLANRDAGKYERGQSPHGLRANPNRAYDNEILGEFYKGIRPFSNAKLGMYWRGPLELLDGSKVEVVLLEDQDVDNPTYTVILREPPAALKGLAEEIASVEFPSARAALITIERSCNRALFRQHGEGHRVDVSA